MPAAPPSPWLAVGGFFLLYRHSAGACRLCNCTPPSEDKPRAQQNPFAGYCLPPAHTSLLCAVSEHTAPPGFPTAQPSFLGGAMWSRHAGAGWRPGPLSVLAGAASLCRRPQLPATPPPRLPLSLSSTNSTASPGPSRPSGGNSCALFTIPKHLTILCGVLTSLE